jgi:hypothetical protein
VNADEVVPRHLIWKPLPRQQWVPGHTLEELNRRIWPAQPLDPRVARSILEQLFGAIVMPLWSAGTVWWDFRGANYCSSLQNRTTLSPSRRPSAVVLKSLGPMSEIRRAAPAAANR